MCGKTLPPSCIEEGIYTGTVDLNYSQYGYHLEYLRCCRNNAIINLQKSSGYTYYAFIPPTKYNNNSANFSNVPVPYVCAGESVSIPNSAIDPDGDSLVYTLATPFSGGDSATPTPGPPSYYTTPPTVKYNSGYSPITPFTYKDTVKINSANGLTTIFAPYTGAYVLAFDVAEYRKGVFLTKTRRDIQILIISCKHTDPPVRIFNGLKIYNYAVVAGNRLTFNTDYINGDTISLDVTEGTNLFTNLVPNPPTLKNAVGHDTVHSVFNWKTICSNLSSKPYKFALTVKNNACPPRVIIEYYSITVIPFKGANKLNGQDSACSYGTEEYTALGPKDSTTTFVWTVKGGTIIQGDGTSKVKVLWGNGKIASIQVVEVNAGGCPGDTLFKTIILKPIPKSPDILGKTIVCLNEKADYQAATTVSGSTYFWSVNGGLITKGGITDKISINWNTKDSGLIKMVEINSLGCPGDTVLLKIAKNIPTLDSILGPNSVCPNARGIDYWVLKTLGSKYFWKTAGGTLVSGNGTEAVKINWGNKGNAFVKAVEITKYGCASDTVMLPVVKEYNLRTSPIRGDTSMCEFKVGEKYEVTYSHNSTYDWKIVGGSITSGQGSANITVDWDKAGLGLLQVVETAWDSVNSMPCTGKPVILQVRLNPLPLTSPITGKGATCQNLWGEYYVKGYPGSTFIWKYSVGDTLLGQGNDTIRIIHHHAGNFILSVTEMSKDSCLGPEVKFPVIIHPEPVTHEFKGAGNVCAPDLKGHLYSVVGSPGSTFLWELKGGSFTASKDSDSIVVDWQVPGLRQLKLREVSGDGCIGITRTMNIKVDSLYMEMVKVSTLKNDPSKIEVQWEAKNLHFFGGPFKIYRENTTQDYRELAGTVDINQRSFIDKTAKTSNFSYRYIVEGLNACGKPVNTKKHRSILLKRIPLDDSSNVLKWNEYEGWEDGIRHYYILRKVNEDTAYQAICNSEDTFFNFVTGLDGYKQCYRIAGVKEATDSLVSYSNEVCFEFEPTVYIPNVFTPDNNHLNETFRVFAGNIKAFNIRIYNRWGEELFSSEDPAKQWDGTFRGEKCPEGTYLYLVHVQGLHTTIYRNGTIHLLR